MTNGEERRDQAASMRALSGRLTEMASDARAGGHGRVDLTPSAIDVLAAYLGRWAELADPTCTVELPKEAGALGQEMVRPRCSRCGRLWAGSWLYCPSCGSRRVRES